MSNPEASDPETIESLRERIRKQQQEINRLSAYSAIQNFALVKVLERLDFHATHGADLTLEYEGVRNAAQQLAAMSGDTGAFARYLDYFDQKFLAVYK